MVALLFPHQKQALDLLTKRYGAALFMDMGAGKTRTALEDLAKPDRLPALVLVKSSLVHHWREEARKWIPWIPVIPLSAKIPFRLRRPILQRKNVIITCSFDLFKRIPPPKDGWQFKTVVADESTLLKNHKAARTKAAKRVFRSAKWRRILSGFPAPEGILDLWSQYDLICPGLL